MDLTRCPTPGCASRKPWPRQYLCRGCWFTLQPATRRALNLHDAAAFRRLSDLLEQLRAGVALHQIQITR